MKQVTSTNDLPLHGRLRPDLPYLQFNFLAIHFDGTYFKVDTDRGYERRVERVLAETKQHARFAHAGIAN